MAEEEHEKKLEKALDLMRRVPPQNIQQHLSDVIDLCPGLTEDLLSTVDQPLKVMKDDMKQKDFIICDYNRDADSFRSPWSNLYYPYISDGYIPPIQLRAIEEDLNSAFKIYTDLYYGNKALHSVYVWDIDTGFASAILIKKTIDAHEDSETKGCWDSINVVEVTERLGRPSHYKLTSTVLTWLVSEGDEVVNLGGSVTRQKEDDIASDNGHTENIGRMVEAMENNIRSQIDSVYFGKTRDVVNSMRSLTSLSAKRQMIGLNAQLASVLSQRKPID